MIHPTRTNLLRLKDRSRAVSNSIRILRARRQALISEFLKSVRPFVDSREELRRDYQLALIELNLARGLEGPAYLDSLIAADNHRLEIDARSRNILGVSYWEVSAHNLVERHPGERPYDELGHSAHIEESCARFDRITAALLDLAVYESKLKRLGEEIQKLTRRTRVLEERVRPRLQREIRAIGAYLGERERESFFRLKRFKSAGKGAMQPG